MRRCFFILLTILFISSLVIPSSASTGNNEIHIDYEEYSSNQNQYDALLLNGYTLFIYVSDEYKEAVLNSIRSSSTDQNHLSDSGLTRSSSKPTETWHIHARGAYPIKGTCTTYSLYLDYQITGCTTYEVEVFNLFDSSSITYVPHGHSNNVSSVTIPPSTMVKTVITTSSENDSFYIGFYPPAYVEGFIRCIAH